MRAGHLGSNPQRDVQHRLLADSATNPAAAVPTAQLRQKKAIRSLGNRFARSLFVAGHKLGNRQRSLHDLVFAEQLIVGEIRQPVRKQIEVERAAEHATDAAR